jgi:hypothetical protein
MGGRGNVYRIRILNGRIVHKVHVIVITAYKGSLAHRREAFKRRLNALLVFHLISLKRQALSVRLVTAWQL